MNVRPLLEWWRLFYKRFSPSHLHCAKSLNMTQMSFATCQNNKRYARATIGCIELCLLALRFIIFQKEMFFFIIIFLHSLCLSFVHFFHPLELVSSRSSHIKYTMYAQLVWFVCVLDIIVDTNQTNYVKMDAKDVVKKNHYNWKLC